LNEPTNGPAPRPFLAEVDAATFIAKHQLHEEMFGPAALLVRVEDLWTRRCKCCRPWAAV
jgi:hypothetical protein